VGDRGAATLRCALDDPSTCCTDGSRFGSILASIARPSKHGSHHVCDNRAPQRTSSMRMALTDSWKPCAPIQHLVLDIGSHCRLGLGSYVAPYLRTVRRYRSLFLRESCYTVLRPSPVSSSQVFAWTLLENPTTANNNRLDDCGNGERYPQQWHGVGLEDTTSNLAVPLAAIL
jgi:hypothetical protein